MSEFRLKLPPGKHALRSSLNQIIFSKKAVYVVNQENIVSPATRAIKYEVTNGFSALLSQFGCTLLVSTYQAGKLVVIRSVESQLKLSFHNFEQAMGVSVSADEIVVGGRGVIWSLKSAPFVATQMKHRSGYDACFLTRSGHVCDDIHLHELAHGRAGLWIVNTKFSCLCTLDGEYSFVPRWRPGFITNLAPEDRCHLNGLAMSHGRPAFVSVMGMTDTEKGWRRDKIHGGCVLEVDSNSPVVTGLSMPHSPRLHHGRLFVLDSGRGRFGFVENAGPNGHFMPITQLPGFTRGLAFLGPYAIIGLSKIRESNMFGGVPISERSQDLKCAVVIIDLRTGKKVEHFEFVEGVDEIFDVQMIPHVSNPFVGGVHTHVDNTPVVWAVPAPGEEPAILEADGDSDDHLGMPLANSEMRNAKTTVQSLHHFMEGLSELKNSNYQAAASAFEKSVNDSPHMADAWCNQGVALQLLGDLEGAVEKLKRAIELQPNMASAHFNLGVTLLLCGDFIEGWEEYEWRWRCAEFGRKPTAIESIAPAWQNESLVGKSILVYGEQGIGDEVMFHSCLPDLIERGGDVLVSCEFRLTALLRRSFPQVVVFESDRMAKERWRERLGKIDFQIAVGSLPRWFHTALTPIAKRKAYLRADATLVEQWKRRIPPGKPKIGISWKGGLKLDHGLRSTELDQWRPVFENLDATWISLQYGNHQPEIQELRERIGVSICDPRRVDPQSELDDFLALIATMDLVISVDNSTVHFAGALGIPTLAMVVFPSMSHWRWGVEPHSTRWYPSLTLIRKDRNDSWNEVFTKVIREAKRRLANTKIT